MVLDDTLGLALDALAVVSDQVVLGDDQAVDVGAVVSDQAILTDQVTHQTQFQVPTSD